jgi:hypothetical protein
MVVISVTLRPRFTSGKIPLLAIGYESGCVLELVWTQRLEGKSLSSAGDRTPFVQSIFRHYKN